ncbi:MAG: phosphoglucosamine mutase [Magnetococcales bacterium]|nr:phosphoglucosamine mutase [Magnetococcales bacterium]
MGEASPRLFGTDGIRGLANRHPMTVDLVMRLGQAAGVALRTGAHRHMVVIGKDTRLSGYMFESALQAGFTSVGVHCQLVGPLPTPAIAFLTRALRADAGVVISASHNPYHDNGIKFFGPNGMKLPDETEMAIETLLQDPALNQRLAIPAELGRAKRIDDAAGRYIEFCKNSFPRDLRLDGLRVAMDCAHGAAYRVAPAVFWELGAEVIAIGDDPNGLNINQDAGSLHPEFLQAKVREVRADVGLAFDGDADRLMVCDETGRLLDGDRILALCAREMQAQNILKGGSVVATVMSNLGLERYLTGLGLGLIRTKVGDRPVLERMLKEGCNLGGEQSGHLIFLDHNTTGDGIISGLKVLEAMARHGKPLSQLTEGMTTVPQVLKNVTLPPGSDPMTQETVLQGLARVEREIAGSGRLLVRKSGTEPKVRVMLEGDDAQRIDTLADELCDLIRKTCP